MAKEEVKEIAERIAQYECHGRSLDDIIAEYDNQLKPVEHRWVEEIGSMLKHPENVHEKEDFCPACGHRLLELEYMSGAHSWRYLAGRGGLLTICPYCRKEFGFSCTIMN